MFAMTVRDQAGTECSSCWPTSAPHNGIETSFKSGEDAFREEGLAMEISRHALLHMSVHRVEEEHEQSVFYVKTGMETQSK